MQLMHKKTLKVLKLLSRAETEVSVKVYEDGKAFSLEELHNVFLMLFEAKMLSEVAGMQK